MEERFKWIGEVEFEGTADEFNQLMGFLETLPITIRYPKKRYPKPSGGLPPPPELQLHPKILESVLEDKPRLNLKFLQDIRGGIQPPHLHLADKVILVDVTQLKESLQHVMQDLNKPGKVR